MQGTDSTTLPPANISQASPEGDGPEDAWPAFERYRQETREHHQKYPKDWDDVQEQLWHAAYIYSLGVDLYLLNRTLMVDSVPVIDAAVWVLRAVYIAFVFNCTMKCRFAAVEWRRGGLYSEEQRAIDFDRRSAAFFWLMSSLLVAYKVASWTWRLLGRRG